MLPPNPDPPLLLDDFLDDFFDDFLVPAPDRLGALLADRLLLLSFLSFFFFFFFGFFDDFWPKLSSGLINVGDCCSGLLFPVFDLLRLLLDRLGAALGRLEPDLDLFFFEANLDFLLGDGSGEGRLLPSSCSGGTSLMLFGAFFGVFGSLPSLSFSIDLFMFWTAFLNVSLMEEKNLSWKSPRMLAEVFEVTESLLFLAEGGTPLFWLLGLGGALDCAGFEL